MDRGPQPSVEVRRHGAANLKRTATRMNAESVVPDLKLVVRLDDGAMAEVCAGPSFIAHAPLHAIAVAVVGERIRCGLDQLSYVLYIPEKDKKLGLWPASKVEGKAQHRIGRNA